MLYETKDLTICHGRGLSRVAYPGTKAMREPGTWDRRVEFPMSFFIMPNPGSCRNIIRAYG